jgi:hypothetical protein
MGCTTPKTLEEKRELIGLIGHCGFGPTGMSNGDRLYN